MQEKNALYTQLLGIEEPMQATCKNIFFITWMFNIKTNNNISNYRSLLSICILYKIHISYTIRIHIICKLSVEQQICVNKYWSRLTTLHEIQQRNCQLKQLLKPWISKWGTNAFCIVVIVLVLNILACRIFRISEFSWPANLLHVTAR